MITAASEAAAQRMRRYLADYNRQYPAAWKLLDEFRAMRDQGRLESWPSWCFCPLAGAYAVVSGGGSLRVPPNQVDRIGKLGALAAWRPSQGIYQFDATVLQSLYETPVTGEIPAEVLFRLPEWCCYIVLQDPPPSLEGCLGFLVHIEYDVNLKHAEVRFVVDSDVGLLMPIPLNLVGTLDQCVDSVVAESKEYGRTAAFAGELAADRPELAALPELIGSDAVKSMIRPLLSVALYLCSTTAEIAGHGPRHRPRATRTKAGDRMFAPDKPRFWEVAYRLGAAIRHAKERERSIPQGGTHASPRAHVRRAHWHSFWTGPKAKPDLPQPSDRKLILHWLPPIPVNIEEGAGVVPTVHEVEGPNAA